VRLLLAFVVAALAVLPRGSTAHADESEAPPAAAIVITFDPNAVQEERVVAAVKAHLSGLPVRVLVRPLIRSGSVAQNVARAGALATASAALGTSSIEVGDDGAFLIYFTEPGGESTLIRRLPPNEEGARVTVEEASIVVRSLVLALLEGRRIGMAKPQDRGAGPERPRKDQPRRETRKDGRSAPSERAAPPANVEDPPMVDSPAEDTPGSAAGEESSRASGSESVVSVTAGYAGTHFATNTSWQSGFTPGFRWVAFRPVYVAARYTFFPKLEGGTKETAVSVARHPGELAVGYVGTTRLAANAELGIVFDYTSRQTRSNGPGFEPTPTSRRSTLAFGARAGASFAFVPAVELALRGGADFLVTRYAYVMPDGRTVAAPHGVRPRVDVELAASLW
jgi:hypothetical protein